MTKPKPGNREFMSVEDLPYPIARLYAEARDEEDVGKQFRALIRAFAGFLKYSSLIAVSGYLQETSPRDERIDEILAGPALSRPSLGHWNAFLRDILRFYRREDRPMPADGLMDFYLKPGSEKLSPHVQKIDEFISLRNEYVHPDIWPESEVAKELCDRCVPMLNELLLAAQFLTTSPLLLARDDGRLLCMGEDVQSFRLEQRDDKQTSTGFFIKTGAGEMSLLTFLLFGIPGNARRTEKADPNDILLYEGRTTKKVKFLRGNSVSHVEQDSFDRVDKLLQQFAQALGKSDEVEKATFRKQNVEDPDWQRLSEHTRKSSTKTVNFHIDQRKYHRDFYLPRTELEREFANYVASERHMAIFVGDSGCGKTNLFCHLTEEAIAQGHSVLHFYGRNYPGGSMIAWIADELVVKEDQLIPFLQQLKSAPEVSAGKRLILFVDAINEYSDPEALYSEIAVLSDVLDQAEIDYCRNVISTRSAIWKRIEARFSFPRERVWYAQNGSEGEEEPCLHISVFGPDEAQLAYEKYASLHEEVRDFFGFKLRTPFLELPVSVRLLAANPIFLKILFKSATEIHKDLTATDILLNYYEDEDTLPIKHRYFLHYFLQALWDTKSDFMTEDRIVESANDPNLADGDYRLRLAEYYTENPVNAAVHRYECEQHNGLKRVEQTNDKKCALCGRDMREVDIPVRSTFFFLVDEGILSVFQSGKENDRTILIRFTYDRMFEMMMARHLFHMLRENGDADEPSVIIRNWLKDTEQSVAYDDVLENLLVLMLDFDVAPEPRDKSHNDILYTLKRKEAVDEEGYLALVLDLLSTQKARVASIVRRALVRLGSDPTRLAVIERLVTKLCEQAMRRKTSPQLQQMLTRTALEVARELSLVSPFFLAAGHRDPAIRAQAACQSYFLWKRDEKVGRELLQEVFGRMYRFHIMPQPRMIEFALGTSVMIAFGHFREPETMNLILSLGRRAARRAGWLLRLLPYVLPGFIEKVLKDVPDDYNAINLTELRQAKKQMVADKSMQELGLRYLRLMQPGTRTDPKERVATATAIIKQAPKNELLMIIHQLILDKAAAEDRAQAIESELRIAHMALKHNEDFWITVSGFGLFQLTVSQQDTDEHLYRGIVEYWQTVIDRQVYQCRCMSDAAYYNWPIAGIGLLLAERQGTRLPDAVSEVISKLLAEADPTGLHAFLKGIDLVGPELGTLYPSAIRYACAVIDHILRLDQPMDPSCYERLIRTLCRMQHLFPDETEILVSALPSDIRARAMDRARTIEINENIGTWVSQRGQDFFLFAMGEKYWQSLWSDAFENFITSKSLAASLKHLLRRIVVDELLKQDHNAGFET